MITSNEIADKMNLKKIRNNLRLTGALLFCILYIPHIFWYYFDRIGEGKIRDDVIGMRRKVGLPQWPALLCLLYFIHSNSYFRSLFYYRVGAVKASFISWYRPGNSSFIISKSLEMEGGCLIAHPYATIINADYIGRNFSCRNCTTIGKKGSKRPTIGDNVYVGANVVILGGIHIGNNVTIGAGSVVVKDLPDNCVAAGNPAKVLKYKTE